MMSRRPLGPRGTPVLAVEAAPGPGALLPGGRISGRISLSGCDTGRRIDHIALAPVARIADTCDRGGSGRLVAFGCLDLVDGFRLAGNEQRYITFDTVLPWETPIIELRGREPAVELGLRVELAVTGIKRRGRVSPLRVHPPPAQKVVLAAVERLGFDFTTAELKPGHTRGSKRTLPFHQRIRFSPPEGLRGLSGLNVTFLANRGSVEVILCADRSGGHSPVNRHVIRHEDVTRHDWSAVVDAWMRQLVTSLGHRTVPASRKGEGSLR